MNSPGIPQEGFSLAMPLYLSMGIPLESYILMKTIDVIPDVAKTLLNVTANMWVLLFVSRLMGDSEAEAQESF
jgi:Na+/H+-dicarboxylate symporter